MIDIIKDFPLWIQISLFSAPVLGLLFAGTGLMLNVKQSKRAGQQFRLSIVADAFQKFADDELMQKAFYKIEYSDFSYDPQKFHGSKIEIEIDRLLRHFSTIALYWKSGLISVNDTLPLKYHVIRIVGDPDVRKYLEFVGKWAESQNIDGHPYATLIELFDVYHSKWPSRKQ